MHATVYINMWAKAINEPKVIHFYELCNIMYEKIQKITKLKVCYLTSEKEILLVVTDILSLLRVASVSSLGKELELWFLFVTTTRSIGK